MKNVFKISIAFIVLALQISCNEDQENVINPISETRSIQISEDLLFSVNEIEKEIKLTLNKPALKHGAIIVNLGEEFSKFFIADFDPAANSSVSLPIIPGDSEISFFVSLNLNELPTNISVVTLEITSVSDGFTIGKKKSINLTVLPDPNSYPVTIDFQQSYDSINEALSNPHIIKIRFSSLAPAAGKILLGVEGNYSSFHTDPPISQNGKIELSVDPGMAEVTLIVDAIDNNLLQGHQSIQFNIEETWGGIIVGSDLSYRLTILDDELLSKPKSYETISKDWKSKKTYFYDEQGRIDKIEWENHTPYQRNGTDQYYYGANGLVERINHYPDIDEYFYYENNRIIRSEEVKNGVISEYSLFDYDQAGNIGGEAKYYRNSNGEYVESFVFIYLFTTAGDLYKQLTYIPVDSEEEYELITTTAFEDYSEHRNPFPVFEILPNHQSQIHLPLKYSFEGNGSQLIYNMTYEFRLDGLPIKRKVAENWGTEVTTYEYY